MKDKQIFKTFQVKKITIVKILANLDCFATYHQTLFVIVPEPYLDGSDNGSSSS